MSSLRDLRNRARALRVTLASANCSFDSARRRFARTLENLPAHLRGGACHAIDQSCARRALLQALSLSNDGETDLCAEIARMSQEPAELLALMHAIRDDAPASPAPVIVLRGNSMHRTVVSAFVNLFRQQAAVIDRQLHRHARYVVTTRGDWLEATPTHASDETDELEGPPWLTPVPPQCLALEKDDESRPDHVRACVDAARLPLTDTPFTVIPSELGEPLLEVRFIASFFTRNVTLVPWPVLQRCVLYMGGGLWHRSNKPSKFFRAMQNIARWDRHVFAALTLALRRRRAAAVGLEVFGGVYRGDNTTEVLDRDVVARRNVILQQVWAPPQGARRLALFAYDWMTDAWVRELGVALGSTTPAEGGAWSPRCVWRELLPRGFHFGCIVKPVYPLRAVAVDVDRTAVAPCPQRRPTCANLVDRLTMQFALRLLFAS